MSDPEATNPPRQPNTPRNALKRAWAWLLANPIYSIPLAAFVAGVILGKII